MEITVRNVLYSEFPVYSNGDSSVSVNEFDKLPFRPEREFVIFGSSGTVVRGEHAHRESWAAFRVFGGSVTFNLFDGVNRQVVVLNNPKMVLLVGPMVLHPYLLEKGAVLAVTISSPYSQHDQVGEEEFNELTKKK